MLKYFIAWASVIVLSPLLLGVGAVECSGKEMLLRPRPIHSMVAQLTDCLMECTGMTFIQKLQLQDQHNIRLKDSTEGDLEEYCWSTDLKCNTGESFQQAYVVVPVDITIGHERLEVKTTVPIASTLQVHNSPTTIADSCGLRYDVTEHFSTRNSGPLFCVQVVTQRDTLGDSVVRCPPYLVTFWQRSQLNHQVGQ